MQGPQSENQESEEDADTLHWHRLYRPNAMTASRQNIETLR